MSDNSLETQVANKIDQIIHTENFNDKYKVYLYFNGVLSLRDIQSNKAIFDIDGVYADSFKVVLPDLRGPLCFYNDIKKEDYDENTFLFKDPSNYEKIKNASWFLYSIASPEIKSLSSAWWLKTTPQIRRIYELWGNSDLDKKEDQNRIIDTMATLVAPKNFQHTYDLKPWRLSEGKCSVYYKDFMCFCIGIYFSDFFDSAFYNEAGMCIDVGCGYTPMFCRKNSPGTWRFDSPYNRAYNLYDKLAHLSPRNR